MSTPGPVVGRGRSADVFDVGGGKVLRTYRDPDHDTAGEASIMAYVHARGLPVPELFSAHGPDMVMERVNGPTMLGVLGKRPDRILGLVRVLADLHEQVHAIEAPKDMRTPFGEGKSVLHLDLHPGNVILSERGPVIIDWPNAARGPAEADNLYTWLILKTSNVPGGIVIRSLAAGFQGVVAARFKSQVGADTRSPMMVRVAERRLADRNLEPAETVRITRLISRRAGGPIERT